jgi:hypothetical protein
MIFNNNHGKINVKNNPLTHSVFESSNKHGHIVPGSSEFLITEGGQFIITEGGQKLIT